MHLKRGWMWMTQLAAWTALGAALMAGASLPGGRDMTTEAGGDPSGRTISGGVVHELPDDLKTLLANQEALRRRWEDLTPLARNEWICWVTSAKKGETRQVRLTRLREELKAGKRRPCCWPGCPHREKTGR